MTDASGASVWSLEARPFGDGSAPTGSASLDLRFPGQYFDSETGLHQNWHRDYAPGLGRYIEPDPIGLDGGLNLFAYVASNPMRFTDPTGLRQPWEPRLCWRVKFHNGDSQIVCSDVHINPPTCVEDGSCDRVQDPCPPKYRCRVNWRIFRWCMVSGNNAPGPELPNRPPPNPPDLPGTRGTSGGAGGARTGLSWFNGCLWKARECGFFPGDCARVYCGSGK